MIPTLYKITPAVNLRAIRTDRFKNAQLSISFILPADRELSPLTTLLFSVLCANQFNTSLIMSPDFL